MTNGPSSPYLSSSSSIETTSSSSSLSPSSSSSVDPNSSWDTASLGLTNVTTSSSTSCDLDDHHHFLATSAGEGVGAKDWSESGLKSRRGWEHLEQKGKGKAPLSPSLGIEAELEVREDVECRDRVRDYPDYPSDNTNNRNSLAETIRQGSSHESSLPHLPLPPSTPPCLLERSTSSKRRSRSFSAFTSQELPSCNTPHSSVLRPLPNPHQSSSTSNPTSSTSSVHIRPLPTPRRSSNNLRPLPTPPSSSPVPTTTTDSVAATSSKALHFTLPPPLAVSTTALTPPVSASRPSSTSPNAPLPSPKPAWLASKPLSPLAPTFHPQASTPQTSLTSSTQTPPPTRSSSGGFIPRHRSTSSAAAFIPSPSSSSLSQPSNLSSSFTPPLPSPTSLTPIGRAPPQPNRHLATAEFSSRSKGSSANGLKGRLAAWGNAVGGAYQEGNNYFGRSSPTLESAPFFGGSEGKGELSGKSFAGTAVRHLNSAWKGRSSSSSIPTTHANLRPSGDSLARSVPYSTRLSAESFGPGGKVFGRDVEAAGREWGIRSYPDLGMRKERDHKVLPVGSRGREVLPAMFVRCVDFLEIWAPQEEGVFRVSGRTTQIQKLRSLFDTGADIDLENAEPSDLDPHIVSAIWKSYLRELPSPILTSTLTPSFDALLRKHTGSPARDNGFGGSSTPPPAQTSPRKSEEQKVALLTEMTELIGRLGEAHYWLLKTIADLLGWTNKHSAENKMPIQNLLVVFCPSLSLSPPFLRFLITNRAELFVTHTKAGAFSSSSLPGATTSSPSAPPPLPARSKPPTTANDFAASRPAPDPPALPNRDAPFLDLPSDLAAISSFSPVTTPPAQVTSLPPAPPSPLSYAPTAGVEESSSTSTSRKTSPKRTFAQLLPDKFSSPSWARQASSRNLGLGLEQKKRNFSSPPNPSPTATASSSASSSARASAEVERPTLSKDVLPPAGVVSSRRNIFSSTPIADRFKSNHNTSSNQPTGGGGFALFHRHTNNDPNPPFTSTSTTSSDPPSPRAASPNKFLTRQKTGGSGGFFSSPVSRGHAAASSVGGGGTVAGAGGGGGGGGGKRATWKRSSQFVGDVESSVARSVADAVRAFEGKK